MPAISEKSAKGQNNIIENTLYDGPRYHSMIYAPLVVTLYFFSEPFISLWVGTRYLEYVWIIKLSILFQLVWQSNALAGSIFYGLGKSKNLVL